MFETLGNLLNISVVGEKRQSIAHESHQESGGKKYSLIRRKDILEQIKQGNRLLEEYEEQKQKEEEMTKTLGEYTMFDLQSRILEMTVSKPAFIALIPRNAK